MFKEYVFFVVGDSPLLTHNPGALMKPKGIGTKRPHIPTPEEEAELGTYRNADGDFLIPMVAFRNALLRATAGYKSGKKTLRGLLGHIRTSGEWAVLVDPKSRKKITKYAIDIRRAVIQRKDAIMRARPRFEEWATEVKLIADNEIVGCEEQALLKQMVFILNEVGITIGVGDFRLEKGGWFGMFHVEKSEIR